MASLVHLLRGLDIFSRGRACCLCVACSYSGEGGVVFFSFGRTGNLRTRSSTRLGKTIVQLMNPRYAVSPLGGKGAGNVEREFIRTMGRKFSFEWTFVCRESKLLRGLQQRSFTTGHNDHLQGHNQCTISIEGWAKGTAVLLFVQRSFARLGRLGGYINKYN